LVSVIGLLLVQFVSKEKAMTQNTNSFHQFEYQGWQQSVEQYHHSFGKLTALTVEPLLDTISGARPSLLDVACGPGYVAVSAAKRGWDVQGIDFSEEMIRKAQALYPNVSFRVGDAESLDIETESLHAVTNNFGILHLERPEKATEEAYRVLRQGGVYSFTIWAPPTEAVGFAVMLKAVEEVGNKNVSLPPGPPFFRFSDPEEARRLVEGAGFSDLTCQKLPLVWKLENGSELFDAYFKGTARTGGLLRAQSEQNIANIRRLVEESGESQFRQNGSLLIPMPAWIYTARK
jgi:SAM-dependent methyltransferase